MSVSQDIVRFCEEEEDDVGSDDAEQYAVASMAAKAYQTVGEFIRSVDA